MDFIKFIERSLVTVKRQDAIDKQMAINEMNKQRILSSITEGFNAYVINLALLTAEQSYCEVSKDENNFMNGDITNQIKEAFTLCASKRCWYVKSTFKKLISSRSYGVYQPMASFTFV